MRTQTILSSATLLLAGYGFGPARLAAQDSPVVASDSSTQPILIQPKKKKKNASAPAANTAPIVVRSSGFTHAQNGHNCNYSNVNKQNFQAVSFEAYNSSADSTPVTLPSSGTWSACFLDGTGATRVMFAGNGKDLSWLTVTYNPAPMEDGTHQDGEDVPNYYFTRIQVYTASTNCTGTAAATYNQGSRVPFTGCVHYCPTGDSSCGKTQSKCVIPAPHR